MKKMICLCLLMCQLCIKNSQPEPEPFATKAIVTKQTQPAQIIYAHAINPTILQETCKAIYTFLPVRIKNATFSDKNPFSEKSLSEKEQIEFAKKLLQSLNISTEGVLFQLNLSYHAARVTHLVDEKFNFNYQKLTSLCIILLEIIKTTYIKFEPNTKQHQEFINEILTFVNKNLFKKIFFTIDSDMAQLPEVPNVFDFDVDYRLAEEVTKNNIDIQYNIPIVPYDAIIFLAKILNNKTSNALVNLSKNNTVELDEFYNVYFKIKFLENYNFYLSNIQLHNLIFKNYNPENVSIEEQFIIKLLQLPNDEIKNTIRTINQDKLISVYNSILNNVSFSNNTNKNQYTLKDTSMSIIEICSMFVKLDYALKNNLASLNKKYDQAITIEEEKVQLYKPKTTPAYPVISEISDTEEKTASLPQIIQSILQEPNPSVPVITQEKVTLPQREKTEDLPSKPSVPVIPEKTVPLPKIKPSVSVITEKETVNQSWYSWFNSWLNPYEWYRWFYIT